MNASNFWAPSSTSSRLEAIASSLEAIASSLEAIASRSLKVFFFFFFFF